MGHGGERDPAGPERSPDAGDDDRDAPVSRRGRRPGGADTRAEILQAARGAFAAHGFHAATIRGVAATAEVDPALVLHYFGSKEDLFAACLDFPLRPADAAEMIMGDGVEHAGRNAARLFFTVWENPATRDALLTMLRGAFDTAQGATALREFITSALLERVIPHIEGPDPQLRMTLAASHLIGVAVLRYVVGFQHVGEASVDDLVDIVAPRLQSYLTG